MSVRLCVGYTGDPYAKTAEPIEMTFGMQTRVGQSNRVLDGVRVAPPGEYD